MSIKTIIGNGLIKVWTANVSTIAVISVIELKEISIILLTLITAGYTLWKWIKEAKKKK